MGSGVGQAARAWTAAHRPELCFWTLGILAYGGMALYFAVGQFLDQPSRDVWQHLASLRELIANPFHPHNPFVPTDEPSRHFNAYWVAMALVARGLGWNAWQALALGGFVSAGALLAGIRCFAGAFFRDRWGSAALLAAMLLSWTYPLSHTGYHSPLTLIEGIAYPACFLIGLSLLLGGLTIRALEGTRSPWWLALLAAAMLATHQLGALIGYVFAGCFVLFHPATPRRRFTAGAAIAAGAAAALLWPWYSPAAAMLRVGNPTWSGGVDFYSPSQLFAAFIPSGAGIAGLLHPSVRRHARPVIAALVLYLLAFLAGRHGIMIATRMIMPAVLMMQIGLAALLLRLIPAWPTLGRRVQLPLFTAAALSLALNALGTADTLHQLVESQAQTGDISAISARLTADLPAREPVAAWDVAAWPLVGAGRHVVSIPWPEPMIADLGARQRLNERLFDPRIAREERVAIARRLGTRVLIVDRRGSLDKRMGAGTLRRLLQGEQAVRNDGPLVRIDLGG